MLNSNTCSENHHPCWIPSVWLLRGNGIGCFMSFTKSLECSNLRLWLHLWAHTCYCWVGEGEVWSPEFVQNLLALFRFSKKTSAITNWADINLMQKHIHVGWIWILGQSFLLCASLWCTYLPVTSFASCCAVGIRSPRVILKPPSSVSTHWNLPSVKNKLHPTPP